MGNQLGCAQGACCATSDGNIDLQTQVDTNHNKAKQLLHSNTTSAQSRERGKFDVSDGNIDIG
jgi:hypothetical protein|tara:strand:+ start:26 stop:214 length:189 start_codon:yes stop_codon:yes gene_type:complete